MVDLCYSICYSDLMEGMPPERLKFYIRKIKTSISSPYSKITKKKPTKKKSKCNTKQLEYHRRRYWLKKGITELPLKRPYTEKEKREAKQGVYGESYLILKLETLKENQRLRRLKKKTSRLKGTGFEGGYKKLLYSASKADRPVTLSLEDYKTLVRPNSCHYCSNPLPESGHALDRKDNSQGYTRSNVVPCCGLCNMTKGRFISYDEMLILIQYRKSKT